MSTLPPDSEVFDDAEALADAAAAMIAERLDAAGPARRAICLSGGTTPELLYKRLAADAAIPFATLHLFWGDERLIAPDAKDNNAHMTLAAFGDAPIPPQNIHRIPTTGLSGAESAAAYQRELQAFAGSATLDPGRPLFDVVLLGLGEDGHTASLFPGRPDVDEKERWAVAVEETGSPPVPRVSLTLPALSSSREALFLVTGERKRAALAAIAAGEGLPAGRVRSAGRVRWLVTRDAVP